MIFLRFLKRFSILRLKIEFTFAVFEICNRLIQEFDNEKLSSIPLKITEEKIENSSSWTWMLNELFHLNSSKIAMFSFSSSVSPA